MLVHRALGNRSYLMASKAGNNDLVKGDRFEWGSNIMGPHVIVDVLDIDPAKREARVGVNYLWHKAPIPENWYFGGVEVDGGGFRVTPHGIKPVPPREPVTRLRGLVDAYAAALDVAERHGRPDIQLEALGDIAQEIGRLASRVETTSFHPGVSFELGRAVDPAGSSRTRTRARARSAWAFSRQIEEGRQETPARDAAPLTATTRRCLAPGPRWSRWPGSRRRTS